MSWRISWRMALLAVAATASVTATFAPTEASAAGGRGRAVVRVEYDYCGGRLPAYGYDACGYPEFSYGPGSCWRRAIVHTPVGPQPRRVWICG